MLTKEILLTAGACPHALVLFNRLLSWASKPGLDLTTLPRGGWLELGFAPYWGWLQMHITGEDWSLAGADLRGAVLCGVDLRWSDLRGAMLYGADLAGADLRGADLAGADLTGAVLGGASLAGADLTGAVLTGADIWGTGLTGARRAEGDPFISGWVYQDGHLEAVGWGTPGGDGDFV